MIAIAGEKHATAPIPVLLFRIATAEALTADSAPFNAVLGFDILATENHATKGNDNRPYIVARKR